MNKGIVGVAIVLSILGGYYFSQLRSTLNPNYISVRIIDASDCKGPTYTVELGEKNISITKDQVNYEFPILGKGSDTIVKIYAKTNSEGNVIYKLRALYENCGEILGEKRKVEPGWMLYETIRDKEIIFQVRAK